MNIELLRLLARLERSDLTAANDKRSESNAAAWLMAAILTILLCALSSNAIFTISVIAVMLLRVSVMETGGMARTLRTSAAASAFAAIFMLPAALLGSSGAFGNVVLKVFESVLVLSALRERVSWKGLTAAMGQLHMPGIFVLTLDMTVRFLVLLGRYSNAILEAVTLRRVGEENWRNAGTGGVLGTTFLKARQLSEQTGEAMACRCWDAEAAETEGGEVTGFGTGDNREQVRRSWLAFGILALLELAWFALSQSWM